MTTSRLLTALVTTLFIAIGLATAASARTEWCFPTLPTGEEICVPVFVEEIPIKLPPDPGPYAAISIDELGAEMMNILGTTQTKWVLTDGSGQRVFVFDFEAGQAFDVSQQAGP